MRGYLARSKFNKIMQRKKQIEYLQPSKYFTCEEAAETIVQGRKVTKAIESKKYTYRCSGAVYEGKWLGGFRHGQGSITWSDGTKYIGEWNYGQPCKKGKISYTTGDYYEGGWANNKRCGSGTSLNIGGSIYYGKWLDGLQHGYGHESWKNSNSNEGGEYKGYYRLGMKDGEGIYSWKDGSIYEGNWRQN